MKLNFLVTLYTLNSVYAYNSNEGLVLNVVDYVESATAVASKLLHLNERRTHSSTYQEFQTGFFDAAFKFQPRQSTTCFSDGVSYFKGAKETFIAMIFERSLEGQSEFNFEDQSYTLLRKCNYFDTVQATIIDNYIINKVDKLNPNSFGALTLYPLSLLLWMFDWYSVITLVMELSYSWEVFMQRMDWYNVGKMFGKMTKLAVQIHMKDLFSGKVQQRSDQQYFSI